MNEKHESLKTAISDKIEFDKYVYVGIFATTMFDTTDTQLKLAVASLRKQGYSIHYLRMAPLTEKGTARPSTEILKILTKDDVRYKEVWTHREEIVAKFCTEWAARTSA